MVWFLALTWIPLLDDWLPVLAQVLALLKAIGLVLVILSLGQSLSQMTTFFG
jgi:hypothetical protein